MLQNVEALREVKRAEADVRQQTEQAERQAKEILREAERKATQVIEDAKAAADQADRDAVAAAQKAVGHERDGIVKAGEAEAATLRAKVEGGDFTKAVEHVLATFNNRIGAK